MKKLKIVACATLIAFSTPVFAKGGGIGAALGAIGNLFGNDKDEITQVAVVEAEKIYAETSGACEASQSSVCQKYSGGSGNQNAGKEQEIVQISVSSFDTGVFIDSSGGSASGQSVNQAAAAATINQNATGLGK